MSYDSLFAVVVVAAIVVIVIAGFFSKSNKFKEMFKKEKDGLPVSKDTGSPVEGSLNKAEEPANRVYGVDASVDTDVE